MTNSSSFLFYSHLLKWPIGANADISELFSQTQSKPFESELPAILFFILLSVLTFVPTFLYRQSVLKSIFDPFTILLAATVPYKAVTDYFLLLSLKTRQLSGTPKIKEIMVYFVQCMTISASEAKVVGEEKCISMEWMQWLVGRGGWGVTLVNLCLHIIFI